MKKVITFLYALFSSAFICDAALTLTINTATEQLSFGGAETTSANSNYFWTLGSNDTQQDLDVGTGIDTGIGTLSFYKDGFLLSITGENFSGNGGLIDYRNLIGDDQKAFAALQNGSTLVAFFPAETDNIAITVVPEPSQYAALFGAGLLGLGFLRRRSVGCSAIR